LGVSLTYSLEPEILGTGGALRRLERFLLDSPFVVVYGDVLTDLDLGQLYRFHEERRRAAGGCMATLSLYRVPNPSECGIVELNAMGRVVRLVEKPRPEDVFSDLAFSGVLIAEPHFLQAIPREGFCDLGFHTFPLLVAAGKPIYGLPISSGEYLQDIGTHEKYALACHEWPLRLDAHAERYI
jgi:mannose-1-phosphate guanylyltransferase/phosphomannomutase